MQRAPQSRDSSTCPECCALYLENATRLRAFKSTAPDQMQRPIQTRQIREADAKCRHQTRQIRRTGHNQRQLRQGHFWGHCHCPDDRLRFGIVQRDQTVQPRPDLMIQRGSRPRWHSTFFERVLHHAAVARPDSQFSKWSSQRSAGLWARSSQLMSCFFM